jgi:hypothetical protein
MKLTPQMSAGGAPESRANAAAPLPDSFLDDLRARIPLAPLIGRRVHLRHSGKGFMGCCPFHDDRTPSFHVYDDHYHCFGCDAHGDAIAFVMQSEGVGFLDAVHRLAAEVELEVPEGSGAGRAAPDPRVIAEREAKRAREAAERETRREHDRSRKLAQARAIWDAASDPAGTQTEAYLRARGLSLLPGLPVRHADAVPDTNGKRFPAMVVMRTRLDGTFAGVQVTFLARDGSSAKATGAAPARRTITPFTDDAVWLTPPGAHSCVFMGEGVETALSALVAQPDYGAVACLGRRHTNVALPENCTNLVLLADEDTDGVGAKAALIAAERFAS